LFALPGVDAPPGFQADHLRLLRPHALPITEWILASRSSHLWRVFHEDYEFCVVPPSENARDAGADYAYRNWQVDCRPGAIYLFEPDTLHANHRLFAPATFYVLKIERTLVASVARELGLGEQPHFRAAASDSPMVANAFGVLSTAIASGAEPLEAEACLVYALRTLLVESAESPAITARHGGQGAVARARDYLHAHVTTAVTLDDLAGVSGLSRFHLLRSFAHTYGLPPHAYQTQIRVAQVRRELAAGTRPSDIDVGFFDQTHLARHFKRAYGVTPAAYQRATAIPY
jgi:AraC-like DNA-binding protein